MTDTLHRDALPPSHLDTANCDPDDPCHPELREREYESVCGSSGAWLPNPFHPPAWFAHKPAA